jgi:hypothetical protein
MVKQFIHSLICNAWLVHWLGVFFHL